MTNQNTNPFVLPGMGQGSADTAGNPLLASMEMMRQAWAGLTGPGGLAQVMPMTPPMNLQDLEQRIAELRAVESWLRLNLSMLSSTIQGLEVQRSTIATLRSFVDNMGAQAQDAGNWGGASPLEIVLGLKPAPGQSAAKAPAGREGRTDTEARAPDAGARGGAQAGSQADTGSPGAAAPGVAGGGRAAGTASASSASSGGTPRPDADTSSGAAASSAGSAQAISQAAQSASEAWWGMLQQQFNQLAAATAATMPGMTGGAPDRGSAPKPGAAAPGQGGTAAGTAPSGKSTPAASAAGAPAGARRGAARKTSATGTAKPRKAAARKNKIQSDPDQS